MNLMGYFAFVLNDPLGKAQIHYDINKFVLSPISYGLYHYDMGLIMSRSDLRYISSTRFQKSHRLSNWWRTAQWLWKDKPTLLYLSKLSCAKFSWLVSWKMSIGLSVFKTLYLPVVQKSSILDFLLYQHSKRKQFLVYGSFSILFLRPFQNYCLWNWMYMVDLLKNN